MSGFANAKLMGPVGDRTRFELHAVYPTKEKAREIARDLRRGPYYVRVIPGRNGFGVYVHYYYKEPQRDSWQEAAEATLRGASVRRVGRMPKQMMEEEGWFGQAPLILYMSNGVRLYASCDEEGNGPGAIFARLDDGGFTRLL